MDPNENLQRQRELIEAIRLITAGGNAWAYHTLARPTEELCELVAAMDEWLSKGGFFPRAWCAT